MPLSGDGSLAKMELLQQLQCVMHGPAMDGSMVDGDAALGHHLFKVSEAQIIGQVPLDAQQDHRAIEMAAFEHRTPPELVGDVNRTTLLNGLRRILIAEGQELGLSLPVVERTLSVYDEASQQGWGSRDGTSLAGYWSSRSTGQASGEGI